MASTLVVSIGGVTRAVRVDGLLIREVANGFSSAFFACYGYTPTKGQDVKIGLGSLAAGALEFGGRITKVRQVCLGQNTAQIGYDVTAVSYAWLLQRRKVIKAYGSQSATTTVADLISSFSSGFTTTNVEASMASIGAISFQNETLPAALDRIARAVGGQWYVDSSADLHFFVTPEATTATAYTNAAPGTARAPEYEEDLEPVRTRVYFEGLGSVASIAAAIGQTTLPIDDGSPFNASGGTIVHIGGQRITYTGKSSIDGTGSTAAGVSKSPGAIGSVSGNNAVGDISSAFSRKYKVTFVSARGESEAGTASGSGGTGQVSGPAAPGASGTTSGSLTASGAYAYKVTYVTAKGETAVGSSSAVSLTLSGGQNAVSLSSIPTSGDARVTGRRIYRTAAGDSGLDAHYRLVGELRDNSTTSWSDGVADLSRGALAPTSNTTGYGTISLSSIPTGPSGTLSRNIYRAHSGDSYAHYLYVGSIGDNSTTTFTDTAADGNANREAPAISQWGNAAGDTTLSVEDCAKFSSSGGWVQIGSMYVRYTGRSTSSGIGNLTGIPSSGIGSLSSAVQYGTAVTNRPHLTGIPSSGAGSILAVINAGDPVQLLVTVNDTTAQTAMAGWVGGDGIHEEYLQDRRVGETEATARATAALTLLKDPIKTVRFETRDTAARAGRTVTVTLSSPISISGTFRIQTSTLRWADPHGTAGTDPIRRVEATSRLQTFEQVLRGLTGLGAL